MRFNHPINSEQPKNLFTSSDLETSLESTSIEIDAFKSSNSKSKSINSFEKFKNFKNYKTKQKQLLNYLKLAQISIATWPIFLQALVIFIQGNDNKPPSQNEDDGISSTSWAVHYLFTTIFLLLVWTEIFYLTKIFKYLEDIDDITSGPTSSIFISQDKFTYTKIHSLKYKNVLQHAYHCLSGLLLSFGILASIFSIYNKPSAIYWDMMSVCELGWIFVIILYNIDVIKGVAKGIEMFNLRLRMGRRGERDNL